MKVVAGIDLSGRTTGTTAIALLTAQGSSARPLLDEPVAAGRELRGAKGDSRIVELLVDARPDVVAIDAPLRLPHAVVCADETCQRCFPPGNAQSSYTTRMLERSRIWGGSRKARLPMPTVMVAGIAFRAIFLRRLLEREGIEVIETWPTAVFRCIAGRQVLPASLDAVARTRLLLSCIDDPQHSLRQSSTLDEADAVAAAVAAWAYSIGRADFVEDPRWPDEGAIVLPQTAAAAEWRNG